MGEITLTKCINLSQYERESTDEVPEKESRDAGKKPGDSEALSRGSQGEWWPSCFPQGGYCVMLQRILGVYMGEHF